MSVTVAYTRSMKVTDTVATGNPDVSTTNRATIHDQWNTTETLTGSTSPAVSTQAAFQQALSSGAATIDLTNLIGSGGGAVSFNGLAVVYALFQNPATNANSITITFGASNPYLLGGTGWKEILRPGEEFQRRCNGGQTVASGAKTIDLAGTGSQALNCHLVAG